MDETELRTQLKKLFMLGRQIGYFEARNRPISWDWVVKEKQSTFDEANQIVQEIVDKLNK